MSLKYFSIIKGSGAIRTTQVQNISETLKGLKLPEHPLHFLFGQRVADRLVANLLPYVFPLTLLVNSQVKENRPGKMSSISVKKSGARTSRMSSQ